MNIDLPERFKLKGDNDHDYAEVRDSCLHLYGKISVRKVMFAITHLLKNEKQCFYCGKNLKRTTIDHMYARDFGGPTIPNNLVLCCNDCNSEKSNLNAQSYKVFRTMNKWDAEQYRALIVSSNEMAKRNGMFDLPNEWITTCSIDELTIRADKDLCRTKQYKKQLKHFKRYNTFSKPVVVEKSGFVLEGSEIVFIAMRNQVKEIKIIRLDNVAMHI